MRTLYLDMQVFIKYNGLSLQRGKQVLKCCGLFWETRHILQASIVMRDVARERHACSATEGPYIFVFNYIVRCCVRRQNLYFFLHSSLCCFAFHDAPLLNTSLILLLFFKIEGLFWKFHSREGSLRHVFIQRWKFILWVFNEVCTVSTCHVSNFHVSRTKGPISFLETIAMQNWLVEVYFPQYHYIQFVLITTPAHFLTFPGWLVFTNGKRRQLQNGYVVIQIQYT